MSRPDAATAAAAPDLPTLVLPGWVQWCVRARFWLVALASLAYLPVGYAENGFDYTIFRNGARVLLGLSVTNEAGQSGRFGVFAAEPSIQVGPLSLFATTPLAPLGRDTGRLLACLLMALALPLFMWLLERAGRLLTDRTEADLRLVVLLAGLFSVLMWHELVMYAHIDDLLVLLAAAWAMGALGRRRPVELGLALGLAVDAKPWAAGLLPLVLALPAARARLLAAGTALVAVVVAWAPFLAVAGALSGLAHYAILVSANSPLTVLGVPVGAAMPAWVRPAQLVLALVLVSVAVARGRPAAALLLVVAARVSLDAGAYSYYFTGLVAGCALFEVVGTNRRLPWLTAVVAFVELDVKWLLGSSAWLNVAALGLAAVVLVAPLSRLASRPAAP